MIRMIFIALITILFSCETQHITRIKPYSFPTNTKEVILKVNSNNKHYKWIDLRGLISIKTEGLNLRLNIKIVNRKDSLIWFSARGPLGLEIVSGQLTPDTILFLDRVNKTYLQTSFARDKEFIMTELSFYEIQEIITANPKISNKDYKLETSESGLYLNSENESVFINNKYQIQEATWINNRQKIELEIGERQPPHNFPERLSLKIENKDNLIVGINFSDVKFNEPKKLFFKIPDSYVEIK
tara:strand:+ start:6880 stop:7605 length:726 start_codon:yes stop_codon:yes gene_type:complete